MMPTADVIVVGLGPMGSATAWHLAHRGRRVLGFDRYHPPHGQGSSGGRSRIIREAYWESPFYVPLVRRAYDLWAELEARTGRRLLRPTGGLVIGPEDGPLVQGALRSAEAHGVPVSRLAAAAIRTRYAFRPSDDLTGVLEPRAGVLSPDDAVGAMLSEAARHGATLAFDEPVEEWSANGAGVLVRTAFGRYRARRLVLAAGAWMASGMVHLTLPLRVARQTMFWIRPRDPGEAFAPARCPVWLWETRDGPVYYGFPDLGDGPKVARHHGGEVVDPDTVRREVAPEEPEELLAFLAANIPGLHGPVTDARVCLYTNTPDEHFVLGRHPAHPDVLLASPCSGHGFKFAPVIGEVLADLAMDRPPPYDLAPFAVGRFG